MGLPGRRRRASPLLALAAAVLVLSSAPVAAQGDGSASLTVGAAQATINGRQVALGTPVYVSEGVAWGPVRAVAEALGASVQWDASTRQVTVSRGDHSLVFTVDSNTAQVGGRTFHLGGPVTVRDGRAQVPLTVLGQGLGLQVGWDAQAGTVTFAPGMNARTTVTVYDHPTLGPVLADSQGRILYVFLRDQVGVSNCYDRCEQNWPVLTASGDLVEGEGVQGRLGVTLRRDGTHQVTYEGMPLYYFIGDEAAGDANGQGVNGVWFVAPPDPATQASPELRVARNETYGEYLVDAYGRSLYLFTRDQGSTSACYDQCEANWPVLRGTPAVTGNLSGTVGSTSRNDGTSQVTYNGIPLYYFVRDQAPGQVNGQGVGQVWYLVAPDGTAITTAAGR